MGAKCFGGHVSGRLGRISQGGQLHNGVRIVFVLPGGQSAPLVGLGSQWASVLILMFISGHPAERWREGEFGRKNASKRESEIELSLPTTSSLSSPPRLFSRRNLELRPINHGQRARSSVPAGWPRAHFRFMAADSRRGALLLRPRHAHLQRNPPQIKYLTSLLGPSSWRASERLAWNGTCLARTRRLRR